MKSAIRYEAYRKHGQIKNTSTILVRKPEGKYQHVSPHEIIILKSILRELRESETVRGHYKTGR